MTTDKSPGEQTSSLVTVVIPTYNYAHYIAEAIDSVLNQSYPHLEIIVVDDGSTDNTQAVLEKYYDSIIYHYQANQGLSGARNTGITLARGKYIQFLDSDDRLGERAIETRVRELEINRDAAFACCTTRLFIESGQPFGDLAENLFRGWKLPNQANVCASLAYGNIAPPHAFLIRTDAIRESNLCFDSGLGACEDYDFWLKLMCQHGPPVLDREGIVFYRKHITSMSADTKNQTWHDYLMVRRVHQAFQEGALPDAERARGCDYAFAIAASAVKVASRLNHEQHPGDLDSLRNIIDGLTSHLQRDYPSYKAQANYYSSELRLMASDLIAKSGAIDKPRVNSLMAFVPNFPLMAGLHFLQNFSTPEKITHFWNILYQDLKYNLRKLR